MNTAADYNKRFPNCRASTLVRLMERDRVNAELMAGIEARIDAQTRAAFRTFAINVRRSLGGELR